MFLSLAHLVIVMFDIQTPLNPSVFRILRITRLLRSARMLKNINLDASVSERLLLAIPTDSKQESFTPARRC